MTLKHILIAIGIGCCTQAMAQGKLTTFVKKVGTMIDSMSVRGLDRNYIDAPEKPWQLIAKGNVNQTIVSMNADGNILGVDYSARPYLKTQPSQYAGFWAGYRGYGIGYTVNVGGDKGSNLVFGATGGAYGINVRIHSFDNSNPSINLNSELLTEEEQKTWNNVQLIDPIHVRTVIADGYYMFNGKKFSYAAAYDQSVIQKRSAGSLMAGLMYNYTHIDYATDVNGDLVYLMHGLGKVKLWQGSAGVGYAYNWVPARGLLVNVMLMPMVTFVNKLKAFAYATNVPDLMTDDRFWADYISNEEWDEWFYSHVHITPMADKTFNSGISLGFDTRMAVTYNFGRYFISAYGQFNNIRYRHQSTHGYLNDWFINTAIGIRL